MRVEIRGETFEMLPERVLHWPRRKTIAVADLHLGKAEIFRERGLWLPSQAQVDDLELLTDVADRLDVEEILFLGDLVHHHRGLNPELTDLFANWSIETGARVHVLLGNHDRGLDERWPDSWSHIERSDVLDVDGFRFQHDPPEGSSCPHYHWTGHFHPVITLADGVDRLRLPCFVVTSAYGILPAFSRLAGGFEMHPSQSREIYAVAEDRVVRIGPPGRKKTDVDSAF